MVLRPIRHPRHSWSATVCVSAESRVVVKKDRDGGGWAAPLRRQLIRREARILSDLRAVGYPFSPDLLDFGRDYLAMERIEGPTLYHLREELSGRKETLERLAHAVSELHRCGFAHGEIRLGNVILSGNTPYLIDFTTAVRRRNPLFPWFQKLDRLALLWLGRLFFDASPEARSDPVEKAHPVLARLYRQVLAPALKYW